MRAKHFSLTQASTQQITAASTGLIPLPQTGSCPPPVPRALAGFCCPRFENAAWPGHSLLGNLREPLPHMQLLGVACKFQPSFPAFTPVCLSTCSPCSPPTRSLPLPPRQHCPRPLHSSTLLLCLEGACSSWASWSGPLSLCSLSPTPPCALGSLCAMCASLLACVECGAVERAWLFPMTHTSGCR